MTNNKWLIDAIKGEPNSHTAIAFHTGQILEQERIIKVIATWCECETGWDCVFHRVINEIKGENK